MPLTVITNPLAIQFKKIDDSKLPEGLRSIPFSIILSGPDNTATVLPGTNEAAVGSAFRFSTANISTTTSLSAIKSLSFSAQFLSVAENTQFPSLIVFVESSRQTFIFIPKQNPNSNLANVNASLEITSSVPSAIWFIASGAAIASAAQIQINANANNFEMKPFVSIV